MNFAKFLRTPPAAASVLRQLFQILMCAKNLQMIFSSIVAYYLLVS